MLEMTDPCNALKKNEQIPKIKYIYIRFPRYTRFWDEVQGMVASRCALHCLNAEG